jgi:hypothetical protein
MLYNVNCIFNSDFLSFKASKIEIKEANNNL